MEAEACTIDRLIKEEIGTPPLAVNERRVTEPSRDLYGIALSGGGIRSSTFNLGLLQGLHRFKLLEDLDYLSTVSGGGYIGGFWSAWRSRVEAGENRGMFPDGTGSDGLPESDAIRHLREFGNFLAPHLSILSWDTGRMLVNLVSSMVPSLLTAVSVIALAIISWCLVAYGLFAFDRDLSTGVFVAVSVLLLVVTEAMWRRRREETNWLAYAEAVAWGLVCSGFAWYLMHLMLRLNGDPLYEMGRSLPMVGDTGDPADWLYVLMPVGSWAIASVAMSIRRWWGSPWVRTHQDRVRRNSFDRVHARFLLAAFIWIVVAVLWWIGAYAGGIAAGGNQPEITTGLVGSTGLMVWIFSRIQKRISIAPRGSLDAGWLARLKPILPQASAYTSVVLIVVTVVAGIVALDRSDFTYNAPLSIALAAAVILLLAAFLFNPNEIGLHTFYRGRIARTYLGASNPLPQARGKTEERETDDMQLTELSEAAPFHLICCAANDLATRELDALDRGAASAVLSRIGLTVAERCRLWNDVHPAPSLSAAVTASAAAFNPLMGGMSKKLGPAVTFIMASFNLRLGLWLPGVARTEPITLIERALTGLPFFKEMFGLARAEGRHVHLSDGGHFENMALYELIRRHCRFIIASDCGMDPQVSFNDFGNLVRRVRADFGVDVRIDLSPLRPDAGGNSRQTMVAGDIHYPEGDTGILLLFKPGITGSEPADVAQYRARNAVFPHESTTDQFYDEAQWEAYRRLGEHAAHLAFRHVADDLDRVGEAYVGQVFLRARRYGQPLPEGFGDRLARFADRITEIDTLLRRPECARLLREVYKEIDELSRDGHQKWQDDLERAQRQDLAHERQDDPGPQGSHDLAPERRHDLEREEGHDLGLEEGQDLAHERRHDLGRERRHDLERERRHDLGPEQRHDLGPEQRHGLGPEQRHGLGPEQRHDLGPEQRHDLEREERRKGVDDYRSRMPNPEDLAPSLHLIRHALLLLQEVYVGENLEENYQHPLYLGIVNYFARWTSAPLFRLWWPLLKTLYPQPFTRFVERQYGIRAGRHGEERVNGRIGKLEKEVQGFAMDVWRQTHAEPLASTQFILPFMLTLRYEEFAYDVQAAHVVVTKAGPHLVWDAEDFFVPAGLWGVGIGSSSLRQMMDRPRVSGRESGDETARLFVRIRMDPSAGTAAKKAVANEIQLYRSAGFTLIAERDLPPSILEGIDRRDRQLEVDDLNGDDVHGEGGDGGIDDGGGVEGGHGELESGDGGVDGGDGEIDGGEGGVDGGEGGIDGGDGGIDGGDGVMHSRQDSSRKSGFEARSNGEFRSEWMVAPAGGFLRAG